MAANYASWATIADDVIPQAFLTTAELTAAVDDWMQGGTQKAYVQCVYGNVSNWNVTQVTNYYYVFGGLNLARRYFNEPLTNWNTASALNTQAMFVWNHVFNQPIGHFKMGKVTDTNNMFQQASKFNQPLPWNT